VQPSLLGAVAVVHGFTDESSWIVQLTAVPLAASGFAVAALEDQGHGFSEGPQGHIPDIVPVLDDCDVAFAAFRADHPPPLPFFLYGESLGGAIALLLHLRGKNRGLWRDGAVLNCAMCGVSPRFKPPWPLEHLLAAVAAVVPTWQVAFTCGNIPDRSFKLEWKRRLFVASPRRTTAPPRLSSCSACAGSFRGGSRRWTCRSSSCTAAKTPSATRPASRSSTAARGAATRHSESTQGCGIRSSASQRRTSRRCSTKSSPSSRTGPPTPASSRISSSSATRPVWNGWHGRFLSLQYESCRDKTVLNKNIMHLLLNYYNSFTHV
jgi:pimeloyl-ACP methyl ester carboxylesterase